MKRLRISLTVACLVCLAAPRSFAWWTHGHAHITEKAVLHLPDPLQFSFQAKLDFLKSYAAQEPPGKHYIDIDYYPEFFEGTFPRDIDVLIALYGAKIVEQNGTAPWTVGQYVEDLAGQMAAATTAQDWSDLLFTAGELAHYIEDLHNPLHLTLNYNGQLTGNYGIHSRYEGQMILRHLDDLEISPAPGNCVYLLSPVDAIFDGIDVHYWFVDDIIAADTLHRGDPPTYDDAYYDGLWQDTGPFTQDLFRDASQLVASAWYTAWVDAGSPDPLCGPATGDFDGGGIDLADVPLFVDGLLDPTPGAICNGDMDGDGLIDGRDIRLFANALLNP